MTDLPAEYLDPATPPDVVVTDKIRPPISDPTLGVRLGPSGPAPIVNPGHRLVTVGDSLTHGMSSAAVFFTDRSWPALVAEAIGTGFSYPTYGGPLDGLPVNLEALSRRLEDEFGDNINIIETVKLPLVLQRTLDRNEDYWEGRAQDKPPAPSGRHENLAVYGWDVRDALSYTAQNAADTALIPTTDSFAGAVPEHDSAIAAASVLVPFGPQATLLSAAAAHGDNGGIDTLVVALGANNALRSVIDKKPKWSADGYDQLATKGTYNVWCPTHFEKEYTALVQAVRAIKANRVILATVPHVTIAPIARGVNPENPGQKWRDGSRYFPFYTDPWVSEANFNPNKDRKLTHQQARAIDSAIDQYNEVILAAVRQARQDGRDWYVLDLCGILDGLAERRFARDDAAAARNDWTPFVLPAPIAGLTTQFFLSDKSGRIQGGLIGLDAVHPTTSGYGIVAQAVLDILALAGVPSTPVDFAKLLTRDTLNSNPPKLVKQLFQFASPVLRIFAK